MTGVPYDPEHIARFFDDYGDREWEHFDASATDRILDGGAGPGRFTLRL